MIDQRLQAVAQKVPAGSRLADIGTDHAYLLTWLVGQGRLTAAYGVECCAGPLRMARETVRACGLSRQVDLRLGDGLAPLLEEDIDTVTIAGMGGATMIGILERGRPLWPRLRRIILQPMNGEGRLRQWALTHGWDLVDEDLVQENGRWYQIVVLEPRTEPPGELPTDIELIIGPLLLRKNHPLLGQHIENLLAGYRKVVENMANSERAKESVQYQHNLQLIRQLEERSP